MPSFKLFERRWHLSSDDLFLPCSLGALFHGIWTVLVAWQLPKLVTPEDYDCDPSSHFRVFAWIIFLTCVLCCYLEVRLARIALRGAILEDSARSQAERLGKPLFYLLMMQLGANVAATVYAVKEGPLCRDRHGVLDPQEVMLSLVISLWIAAFFAAVALSLAFNMYPDFGSEEHWERRCHCIAGVLCCLGKVKAAAVSEDASVQGGDAETVLKRIAKLFSYLFRHIDLVPSDIAAALYLVALRQRAVQKERSGAVGSLRPPGNRDPLGSGSLEGVGTTARGPTATAATPVPPELLADALRYARFAQASYGAALFLWIEMQRPAGLLRGLGKLLFGVGLPRDVRRALEDPDPPGPRPSGGAPLNLGTFSNPVTAAQRRVEGKARALLAGIPLADVLYTSTHNDITGKLPYFIALDRPHRAVVLAIRGTMSLEDAVTDVLCETAPVSELLEPPALAQMPNATALYAHRGILGAARAIVADVRHQGVLAQLLQGGGGVAQGSPLPGPTCSEASPWVGSADGRTRARPGLTPSAARLVTQGVRSRSPGSSFNAGIAPSDPLAAPPPLSEPPAASSLTAESLQPLLAGLLGSTAPRPGSPPGERTAPGHEVVGGTEVATAGGELLTQDLPDCAGFSLVVTGHSLGAGTAVLVGLALRAEFPSLRVWSFSPPGALLSPALHDHCAAFTRAVVSANDFVPRLSVESLERLRDEMVASLACCPLNKNALLWRSLRAGAGDLPLREVLVPEDQAPAEARACLDRYRASTRTHSLAAYAGRATAPSAWDGGAPTASAPLVGPGPVVLLRPRAEGAAEGSAARFTMLSWFRDGRWRDTLRRTRRGGGPVEGAGAGAGAVSPEVVWEEARSLVEEGILLSPTIFSEHMPNYIVDALQAAVQNGPLMGIQVEN